MYMCCKTEGDRVENWSKNGEDGMSGSTEQGQFCMRMSESYACSKDNINEKQKDGT